MNVDIMISDWKKSYSMYVALTFKNEKILDVAQTMATWTFKRIIVNPVQIRKHKVKST
ncbi:hypothetical protein NTE_01405 [Candidatus Nitrososphaera evergladensis SR1]|jgi:hypothetical protein|uniref:Uncharacterized protein n=1 Tax=Candidatus Nitrososphaera evergladensis SR1 TaxID=1459636 RepID=A0A075MQU7_9ARCH|nr:hypothetical protein NTE_01405 [Candidatus Nitrososphaera evergladensis SR1]